MTQLASQHLWHLGRLYCSISHFGIAAPCTITLLVLQHALRNDFVTGIKIDSDAAPDPVCEPCLAGKMHVLPFRSTGTVTSGIPDLVHGDRVSMTIASASGYRYFVAFHDDASGFHAAYPLCKKSDTFAASTNFHTWAE